MKLSHKIPLLWMAAAAHMVALIVVFSVPALAANIELTNDPATAGPGQFAEEEICRAAAARGMTMFRADGKSLADVIQIKLTVGTPAGTTAVAQSYGIRVRSEDGRRSATETGFRK